MSHYKNASVSTIAAGDLQIGAVEIKDDDSDDRAVVKTASTVADTDKALCVADPNLDAKLPALGTAAMAASVPVTVATDDVVNTAADREIIGDFSAAPVQVSLTTTTARSSQLAVGYYLVKSDARVFVRQGSVSSDATVTTDWALEAGVTYKLYVSNTTTLGYLSGILAAGTGTMDILATV